VPLAKDNCCFASVVSRYLQQILDGFIQFEIEPVESGLDLEVLAQPSPAFLELGTVKAFKCRKRVILLESNSSPCTPFGFTCHHLSVSLQASAQNQIRLPLDDLLHGG
jgi:hypothetical protein